MADCVRLEICLSKGQDENYTAQFECHVQKGDEGVLQGPTTLFPITIERAALVECDWQPQLYGQHLTQSLFAERNAQDIFSEAYLYASTYHLPLRLCINIDRNAPELNSLHWETLLDPETKQPLCTDENILFSRFWNSSRLIPYVPEPRDRLTALAVISNPTNLKQNTLSLKEIDIQKEINYARDGLAETDLSVLGLDTPATLDEIAARINGRDILYLVCHGAYIRGKPCLWLQKPDGTADVVEVDQVKEKFTQMRRSRTRLPMFAILVSCQSAGNNQGSGENALLALGPQLLESGVPAVLAMLGSVSFQTMDAFLPVFFRELWQDGQIDRATRAARRQVLGTQSDWWMPILYSRLADNQLFSLSEDACANAHQDFEPETIYIHAGEFKMGRDPAPGIPEWETPCHVVDLPAYRIGKYPVTNFQFASFIEEAGEDVQKEIHWKEGRPLTSGEEHPVYGITWHQAVAYCKWLSEKTDWNYALPSEAQWEKAARGPRGWLYPWGNEQQENPVTAGTDQLPRSYNCPPQNSYGGFEIAASVREWTSSVWGELRSKPDPAYYYSLQESINKFKPNNMTRRIVRGVPPGNPSVSPFTHRSGFDPDDPGPIGQQIGFRVVRTGRKQVRK